MARHGQLIRLRPGMLDEYRRYHSEVWPGILAKITECNLRNYTIYHHDGLLFASFEYVGDDYEADMQKMADDPLTQKWWAIMKPMQQPVDTRSEGEWWAEMDEVFRLD